MISMLRRTLSTLALLLAGLGLAFSLMAAHAQETSRRGRKYKPPPPTARIEVTVLRAANSRPIENAAVVFHPMEGEKDKGNMELKTNEDGKTVIDVLPIGDTIRVQIIAKGFQTFGHDYKIDKDHVAIEIRMKRPGEQYSIYEGRDPNADPNAHQTAKTDSNDGKDNASGDKSSGTGDSSAPPQQPPAQSQPAPK